MIDGTRVTTKRDRRIGWKLYSLLMIASFGLGIRTGKHKDALAWADWSVALVGAVGLAGLIIYAWRLLTDGLPIWRMVAGLELLMLGLGCWVMAERARAGTNPFVLIVAALLVLAVNGPKIIALWRLGSVPETSRAQESS